jgi:hypothetical protein
MRERPRRRSKVIVPAAVGLVALLVGAYVVVDRGLRCLPDGGCSTGATRRFAGRLFAGDGRALGDASLKVSVFEHADRRTFDLRADGDGRFCFEWPAQASIPRITVRRSGPARSVDPHLRSVARSSGANTRGLYAVMSPESAWDADAATAPVTEIDGWDSTLDQARECKHLA